MRRYEGIKVLVTGGTGFVGSRLVERLAFEEGAEVNVLVNSWSRATWVSRLPVKLIQGSINSIHDLEQAMESCSVVFHCVGLGGTLEQAMKINVNGTHCVLEASKKQGIRRIVYFSSTAVHGPVINNSMDENAPMIKSGDSYADSKIEAESLFKKITVEENIEGVILRPTYVWGPNSTFYTIGIIELMKKKAFSLVDGGKGKCNAVHVDNLVDVAIISGIHKEAAGESFIITDGEDSTWWDFYNYFAKMTGFELAKAPSVYSNPTTANKLMYQFKRLLNNIREGLTKFSNRVEPKSKLIAKIFAKAPRKLVKTALKEIEKHYPEIAEQDLLNYSSTGKIDVTKLEKVLSYKPEKTITQGMKECEIWLRDQNYI